LGQILKKLFLKNPFILEFRSRKRLVVVASHISTDKLLNPL